MITWKVLRSVLRLILTVTIIGCGQQGSDRRARVGITTIIEQPALVDARKGFEDALIKSGWDETRVRIVYENAQGSNQKASQIAAKFIGDNFDLIYAISTPSAVAVAQKTELIPIVFGAVTDPIDARLVASWETPGGNITGVSDLVEAAPQLEFFKKILPDARRVGITFNPGEPSASRTVRALKANAEKYDMQIVEAPAYKSTDVRSAASSLVGKVDFLYIVPDNTIGSALDVMSDISLENRIPLLSCETGAVEKGKAIAALSFDYYKVGQLAGQLAAAILDGARPDTMSVQTLGELDVVINIANAKEIGVVIPQGVVEQAARVIR